MKISFAKPHLPTEGAVIVGVLDNKVFTPTATALDDLAGGGLKRAVEASKFTGKKDQTLTVLAPAGCKVNRVVLVGLGKADAIDALAAQSFGGTGLAQVLTAGDASVAIAVDAVPGLKISEADFAANVAFGARLRSYRFDKYFTKEKKEDKPSVKKLAILTAAPTAKNAFAPWMPSPTACS